MGSAIGGHQEEGFHLETMVMWTESFDVVVFFNIHHFLDGGHDFQGNIIIPPVFQNHQPAMKATQYQVQRQIPIGHWHNGIHGIRIASAHQVTQFLIDHVDGPAVVELGR